MTHRQRWVLILTAIASLMVALDVTVVSTALGSIRTHLDASVDQLEWTVNAYGLSFAVLLMTGAALGDRFGRRRLFAGGMLLFVVASAACALATSIGWLIAARAVQGAGAAVIAPLSLALLSAAFPPERRAWALGVFGAITGLAVVAGPVLGGAITETLAWQWIFWLNVPIGLAAIPLIRTRIEESFGPRAGLDWPGLMLVTAGALGIVWGLVRGNSAGWGSSRSDRHARGRGGRVGRLRFMGAPRATADAADAPVPLPGVRRGQRGHAADVRGAVQRGVLHGPVPADHAWAVAAAGGDRTDPLDRHGHDRVADRGRAGRAGRRASAARRRAC